MQRPDIFDPDNTKWLDNQEDSSDIEFSIKEVEHHLKKPLPTRKAAGSQGDLDMDIQVSTCSILTMSSDTILVSNTSTQ